MRVLALPKYGDLAASTRQRFIQYEPALREAGIDLTCAPLLGNDHLERIVRGRRAAPWSVLLAYLRRVRELVTAREFDLLWIHYELFPYLPAVFERLAFLAGKPIVLDYDDAIFEMYDGSRNGFVRRTLGGKLEPLLKYAAACTCGNNHLIAYTSRFCPRSELFPTVVDTAAYRPLEAASKREPLVIGWIGSPSTWPYVEALLPLLADVAGRYGARIRIVGAGERAVAPAGLPVEFAAWSEQSEIAEVQGMDIGIMPLPDDRWARGKSGYKLIQYMACAVPVVASPVGANKDIVEEGRQGILAASSEVWSQALDRLLADAALRRSMGQAGRLRAEQHYSLAVHAPRLVALFRSILTQGRGG